MTWPAVPTYSAAKAGMITYPRSAGHQLEYQVYRFRIICLCSSAYCCCFGKVIRYKIQMRSFGPTKRMKYVLIPSNYNRYDSLLQFYPKILFFFQTKSYLSLKERGKNTIHIMVTGTFSKLTINTSCLLLGKTPSCSV